MKGNAALRAHYSLQIASHKLIFEDDGIEMHAKTVRALKGSVM